VLSAGLIFYFLLICISVGYKLFEMEHFSIEMEHFNLEMEHFNLEYKLSWARTQTRKAMIFHL